MTASCIFRSNQPPVIEKESSEPSGDTLDVCITFEWIGYDDDGYVSLYQYRTDGGEWVDHDTKTITPGAVIKKEIILLRSGRKMTKGFLLNR
ncbi:hypothetical protein LH53_08980 [Mesotoga sp. TolDC]|nr:hypothetical protein LH53_08980 [Mesotoga sp. TolDC]